MRRRGRASPCDTVRLFDEHDAHPHLARRIRGRNQVPGGHAAARAVTEHERGSGFAGGMQVRVRPAVGSVEFEDRHVSSAYGAETFLGTTIAHASITSPRISSASMAASRTTAHL